MSEAELPDGWALTSIDQIATHYSGNSKLIKGKLSEEPGQSMYPAFSASGQDVWHSEFGEEGPAIIVSAVGARCGKVFRASGKWSAIANTHVVKINPIGGDLDYFYYLLNREHYWVRGGSAQPFVRTKATFERPFPLPPLAEQKRIVAKIEELFSELDAGEESLRRARRQLGVYRQSLLKQAFEGKLTAPWREQHPDLLESPSDLVGLIENCSKRAKFKSEGSHPVDGWSFRCLDELTEFVTSGSRGWAAYYSNSGSLFIRAQNLNRDYLNLDDIAYVRPPESAEGRRTMVRYGDLLITITGANTTKSGWVHLPLDDAYVSQHVALCRPVSDLLSPFLYRYIISEAGGRKKLTADAYGAGKPGLNLDHVRSLVVPFPSLPEQQEIVRLLDEQFEVIEQNEREIDAALKRSEALRQSILKKAFTGQLVPQDPTDEPASALLERIRRDRASAGKTTMKKAARGRNKKASSAGTADNA